MHSMIVTYIQQLNFLTNTNNLPEIICWFIRGQPWRIQDCHWKLRTWVFCKYVIWRNTRNGLPKVTIEKVKVPWYASFKNGFNCCLGFLLTLLVDRWIYSLSIGSPILNEYCFVTCVSRNPHICDLWWYWSVELYFAG